MTRRRRKVKHREHSLLAVRGEHLCVCGHTKASHKRVEGQYRGACRCIVPAACGCAEFCANGQRANDAAFFGVKPKEFR